MTKPGSFGHNYFYSNPAVSSDLILLVRYGRAPGAQHGRPLKIEDYGFWSLDDKYPSSTTAMTTTTTRPISGDAQ